MQCKHTHLIKGADKWTKLGATGEAVASFISDAYWLGGLIDLIAQLDENSVGLSWYGLGIGCALSFGLTVGSVYAHSVVNINHQEGHIHQAYDEHLHGPQRPQINSATEDTPIMARLANQEEDSLTTMQKLALASDFISHIGDIAGPITFVAEIAAKDRMSSWATALVQCGATLFGAAASVAGVRTCKNNMLRINQHCHNPGGDSEGYQPRPVN